MGVLGQLVSLWTGPITKKFNLKKKDLYLFFFSLTYLKFYLFSQNHGDKHVYFKIIKTNIDFHTLRIFKSKCACIELCKYLT